MLACLHILLICLLILLGCPLVGCALGCGMLVLVWDCRNRKFVSSAFAMGGLVCGVYFVVWRVVEGMELAGLVF